MHFEVPKAKKFKEFGGEYVMIVISILTALALEQVVEAVHHRHLAHEAAETMDAELRENIKDLTDALQHNEKKRQALEDARVKLLAGIRDKTSDAELMRRFEQEWKPAFALSLNTPALNQTAWEAAVANQAVTWMPRESLQRYSGAYASLRGISLMMHNGSHVFLDGPGMRNITSDVQMGVSNPRDIYRAANQMVSLYQNIDDNLKALKEQLEQAAGESDKTPT